MKVQQLKMKRTFLIITLVFCLILFPLVVWIGTDVSEFNAILGLIYFFFVMCGLAIFIVHLITKIMQIFKQLNPDKQQKKQ